MPEAMSGVPDRGEELEAWSARVVVFGGESVYGIT
jgi:hypothetical protein